MNAILVVVPDGGALNDPCLHIGIDMVGRNLKVCVKIPRDLTLQIQ
jgi:hypothetical protein